jgi:hypothetical protein
MFVLSRHIPGGKPLATLSGLQGRDLNLGSTIYKAGMPVTVPCSVSVHGLPHLKFIAYGIPCRKLYVDIADEVSFKDTQ